MIRSPRRTPPRLDVAQLERVFGRRLPKAYRQFVASGAYVEKNGWKMAGLPGFDPAWALAVRFDTHTEPDDLLNSSLDPALQKDPLITVLYRDPEFYPSRARRPRPVPMATLHDGQRYDGQEFLAIDLTDPRGPVSLWKHETGRFAPVAESFEAFLGQLLPPRAKPRAQGLAEAHTRAQQVMAASPAKAERILVRALAPFIGDVSRLSTELKDRLAPMFNNLGYCRIRQDRPAEAAEAYSRAVALGSDNAHLNLALTYAEELGEFRKALRLTDKILSDMFIMMGLGEARASVVYATRGLSLLALGREKEAREAYALSEQFLPEIGKARGFAEGLELHIVKNRLPLAAVAAELSTRLRGIARGKIAPQRMRKAK